MTHFLYTLFRRLDEPQKQAGSGYLITRIRVKKICKEQEMKENKINK
jgi:hypothetical protein